MAGEVMAKWEKPMTREQQRRVKSDESPTPRVEQRRKQSADLAAEKVDKFWGKR
jgi:hypothetical protein